MPGFIFYLENTLLTKPYGGKGQIIDPLATFGFNLLLSVVLRNSSTFCEFFCHKVSFVSNLIDLFSDA